MPTLGEQRARISSFEEELSATGEPNDLAEVEGPAVESGKRHVTEAALAESEERYRRLVDLLPAAVYIHDGKSILFINPSGVEMFGGKSADEIVGRSPLDFSHESDKSKLMARATDVLQQKVSKDPMRRRRLRMDGSEYLA